jgi:ubiquitin-protein ligase
LSGSLTVHQFTVDSFSHFHFADFVRFRVRFVTPILHCNVNCYGKICHSIFGRNWTADTTIASIFENVYGLLLTPDIADPIDTNLAMDFHAGTGM